MYGYGPNGSMPTFPPPKLMSSSYSGYSAILNLAVDLIAVRSVSFTSFLFDVVDVGLCLYHFLKLYILQPSFLLVL